MESEKEKRREKVLFDTFWDGDCGGLNCKLRQKCNDTSHSVIM